MRFAVTLSAALFTATVATAAGWTDAVQTEWTIDITTARAAHSDPIEQELEGAMVGDRIIFDIRRIADSAQGVLIVNCTHDRYSIVMLGRHDLTQDEPMANSPIAATLSSTYCPKIDTLPPADAMTPTIASLN